MSATHTHPGIPRQGHTTHHAPHSQEERPRRRRQAHARSKRPARPHHGHAFTIAGIALVVLSCLAVAGLVLRKHIATRRAAAGRAAEVDRGPHVIVARVEPAAGAHDFTLPAEARGYFQTTAYAKVSGYVRDVRVDKGDHVKKGQVLGFVESPETDQMVRGAQADLGLRKQLYGRAKLLAPNVMSVQDLQTATSNMNVSRSSLDSALALQSYETIRAPYDGIVTMRYVDPGALMPAATGSTSSAQPFVDIADPTRLRIEAYVGQDEALYIHPGDPVTVSQDDQNARVEARVTRTSGSLDPRTRTMLCEIEIDNTKGLLLPGAFSQVTFHIHAPPVPRVPAEAVVLRQGKELVAVVRDDRVHLANVKTGVTDGRNVAIVSGLSGDEMVALNLPAEVQDGDVVQATERPAPQASEGNSDAGAPAGSR